jgi:uncharacterized protein YndB with AHSA1/START domain
MKNNEEPGKFTGPAEVRIVRTLPGPIERVWDYLTDSEKRARWFASGSMEQRVGGKVRFEMRHSCIAPGETPPEKFKKVHESGKVFECTITRCEPPRLLAFTFGSDNESEAIFELTPQGKDVLLVLTHRATGGDIPYMHEFAAGWHTHVAQLVAQLEGMEPPPFWPMLMTLKIAYNQARIAAQQS